MDPVELSKLIPSLQREKLMLDIIRENGEMQVEVSGRKGFGAKLTPLVGLDIRQY